MFFAHFVLDMGAFVGDRGGGFWNAVECDPLKYGGR